MKFIYFTDIHLDTGINAFRGFELCVESMLVHQPAALVNGGDLGVTSEALAQYAQVMEDVSVPVLLSHGNHEMCSGYLPREQGGTAHASADIGGVHFVLLDVVHYFEPTEDHPANWHVLADEGLLEWLAADLAEVDRATPLVVASHVPISTTFPQRAGQVPDMAFPTNEMAGARRLLTLLQPFARVITLHGHEHENCRHFIGSMEVMTTAAVAGNWWRTGLERPRPARTRTAGISGGRGRCGRGFQEPVSRFPAASRRGGGTVSASGFGSPLCQCVRWFATHAGRGGGLGAISPDRSVGRIVARSGDAPVGIAGRL